MALYIGLMSGTSVDGVDAALVEVYQRRGRIRATLKEFLVHPHPRALRKKIFALFRDPAGALSLTCELNFWIGEVFAEAALALLRKARVSPKRVAAIGSHGQTVYHIPPVKARAERLIPSTLQIGDASVIAVRTGIVTVADFRTADMAVGGNGAPLITFADYHLLGHPRKGRIVQNIGGIANCTYLPPAASIDEIVAFDTGPGNMVIDGVVTRMTGGKRFYDRGGEVGAKGRVNKGLLAHLLRERYFSLAPPKTTGRELFGEQYCDALIRLARKRAISLPDTVATATALTAESIVRAYEQFVFPLPKGRDFPRCRDLRFAPIRFAPRGRVDEIVLGGGGAHNPTLVQMMRDRLPGATCLPALAGGHRQVRLISHEDVGISSKAKEAIGFAMLAYARLNGIAGNVPSATGAEKAVLLGKIAQ